MLINRLGIIGILLILVGLILLLTDFLDQSFTLLWPLVMGSSEGKAILLFLIMGSILLWNNLIYCIPYLHKFRFLNTDLVSSRNYLKITLILVLLTYILGIIIELWIRYVYNVTPFTTLVVFDPGVSTTSMMHSHIFKAVISSSTNLLGIKVPAHINTANALVNYVPFPAWIIFLTLPLSYITGTLALDKRMYHYRIILSFSLAMTLIGMIDGGIFSNPAVIGLAGLLGIFFIEKPFKPRNLFIPAIIILLLIISGISLDIVGSSTNYHEITMINLNETPDLSNLTLKESYIINNRTIYVIETREPDKIFLKQLFNIFEGKSSGFFITWNFFTYI